MAVDIPHPTKWNHKHIILVTLTGTLVLITLTAIISIILSPAHIFFYIQNPTSHNETDTTQYNFTLVVNNTSPHMAVAYGALSAEIWYSETAWVPALLVNMSSLQERTTRQNPANIGFSAEYWQSEQMSTPAASSSARNQSAPGLGDDKMGWSNCTVLVTATVRFTYGWTWISTRSYNILANCSSVSFIGTGGSVRCE